jgi:dihydrofolate synthase/folylpolyglutamate synthase
MSLSSCRRYLEQAQIFGIRLGLENIKAVLESFGLPQESFPSVHVAGTNGKGSVCAMLDQIFRLHGYRTGLYTSPHLVEVRERIRVDGRMIPEQDFCSLLREIEKKEKKLKKAGLIAGSLTFFEILTIAAFLYFRKKKVEVAVLEVGMGGRFDATNVVRPQVSVITTISFDHQQYLGETLDRIAFEKAGIIKENTPCVCGVKHRVALRVIKKKCQEMNAPLTEVFGQGKRFSWENRPEGPVFRFQSRGGIYKYRPSLPGFHQGENAAVAITAGEAFREKGWKLSKTKIIEAIATTVWPGRLEVFSINPLIILDGCHNEAGARAVSDYLKSRIDQPLILVFAVMKDKEVEKIGRWLFPLASRIILTRPSLERAASPKDIASKMKKYREKFFLEENVASAINLALSLSEGRNPILVAGSLFLVGEAWKFLLPRAGLMWRRKASLVAFQSLKC